MMFIEGSMAPEEASIVGMSKGGQSSEVESTRNERMRARVVLLIASFALAMIVSNGGTLTCCKAVTTQRLPPRRMTEKYHHFKI
jgi:hypothetical protein